MNRVDLKVGGEGHAELEAFLVDRIYEFNSDATGIHDGEVFAAAIPDADGGIIAAVNGHLWGGTCYIAHLWVARSHRGEGLGSSLLASVESEARRRHCHQVVLATHSFQAPAFYERLGYTQVARIAGYPRGSAQLHYTKPLLQSGGSLNQAPSD